MKSFAIGAVCSAVCGFGFPSTIAAQRLAINLNTHSRVEIDRPAAAIWPHILDPSAWKQGMKRSHHAGVVGRLGEVQAASDPANPGTIVFFIENVELVPNQRRTIKLYEPGGRLLGYATWTLEERNGRTVVGYDVYSETVFPTAPKPSAEVLAQRERQEYDANKKRFDAELVALKQLVEKR